jgi:polysaccharide biosynthesis transport protein
MDLIYFFKVLLRRKWIIIGLSLLSVIAAFFFLLNKKPLYKSQAQYSTGFTAEKVRLVDGSSGIDIYTADVKFNNVIETFKSPKVINTISYRLLLHDLKNPGNPYTSLSKNKKESAIYKSVNIDSAIKILEELIPNHQLLPSNTEKEKNLVEFFKLYGYDYETMMSHLLIERVGRTDYLNITFWSDNPDLSALVVNGMGQEFLNYYKNLSSQRTKENAGDIKLMVTSQQRTIDSLGKRLYDERVKQGSIDPVSLSTSAMETVKELESKLAEEKSKQNEHLNRKKYLVERLNFLQARAVPMQNSSNNDEVMRLVNKKNDLVTELAKKGGEDAVLQKQISDLRSEINSKSSVPINKNNTGKAKELDDIRMQVSEEEALLNASNSTVADYTSRIRKYTGMANSAPVGSDVTISGIQTKLEIENSLLSNITEKYYKAEGLTKDDPTTNFIQTAVGQPALGPESKKTMITMVLAGISMLFLSSIIFLLMEIFDRRVKTPTLFKKQIKLNVANILNNIPLKKSSEQEIVTNDYKGRKFSREIFFKNNIRKLRYEFLNSPNKIFLITSTQVNTGKTTIIESIAASLLLSKKNVIIIDLNFGNNTISQKYNPAVFIEDIAGTLKYDIDLKEQHNFITPTDGLSVIGCKEGNFTPSEVLFNIDMNAFLKMLKIDFDFILIEGAALNDFADSCELATYAEEVFTVFSASAPVSHIDDKSIQFIKSLGIKNKGAILNNVLLENINF